MSLLVMSSYPQVVEGTHIQNFIILSQRQKAKFQLRGRTIYSLFSRKTISLVQWRRTAYANDKKTLMLSHGGILMGRLCLFLVIP